MCGIAGIITTRDARLETEVSSIIASLAKRGPDSQNHRCYNPTDDHQVHLIHSRLATVDLSHAGQQPMDHPGRNASLIFNGEVYNFRELRQSYDRNWTSNTDSEVVLESIATHGEDAIQSFNGMFALAYCDWENRQILLARDRLGIKPLYYAFTSDGSLVFASEIKAIIASGILIANHALDANAVAAFLAQGYIPEPRTLSLGIRQIPAGHLARIALPDMSMSIEPYWQIRARTTKTSTEECRQELLHATKLRLQSDAKATTFLSSGLDSSLLTSIANQEQSRTQSITIGFPKNLGLDESVKATQIAKEIGIDHHVEQINLEDLPVLFESYMQTMDQPTIDGFNSYLVSRATRALGYRVAISGLGGDELFAGYATFNQVPLTQKISPLFKFMSFLPLGEGRFAQKIKAMRKRPMDLVSMYLLRREVFLMNMRAELFPDIQSNDDLNYYSLYEPIASEYYDQADTINRISYLELTTYMRNMLLRDTDIFGMAHGLEIRVPMLDHSFVEKILSIHGSEKTMGSGQKPLMQRMFSGLIPNSTVLNEKIGFQLPFQHWLRGPLRSHIEETSNPEVWTTYGLAGESIQEYIQDFLSGGDRLQTTEVLALNSLRHCLKAYRL